MRKNKTSKRIVAGVLALGIIAGAIGIGAYLTDTEVKKDVYTVGNVQAEIVSNGDMELDNVGALLPGTVHTYERAATNTGINDAYVFMSLTIPYEMVGVSEDDGTQIGERVRQLFIPGVDGGYIGSEWKLVDVGYIGQYEIEDNGQYCGEHDAYSAVVGDTITYVYGYIGDNADGSLKALASGETTSNLVETMELANLYHADKIDGEISTKLYAIQSANVNGGLTDVNGVWAVINKAISGEVQEASTLSYSIRNTNTGEAVGYAPLKLVDGNGNVVATSVANSNGSGQFENVPAGDYNIQTAVGDLVLTGGSTGYGLRNKTAAVTITGEDASVALGLETPVNTLVQGPIFNLYIPNNATSVEFVAMPQTYGLADRTVPADAVDVSEKADGSVMAWMEDTTFYVVAMDGGMIYANPNSGYMFQNKSNLTYIGTDNLNTTGVYEGQFIFNGCGTLTNGIEDFDFSNMRSFNNAFDSCSWITEYTIPEGTTIIPNGTFAWCTGLKTIVIPSSVKNIYNSAFNGCSSLETISIPEGVETIGSFAFANCYNLKTVYIPASVTFIDSSSYSPFYYCNNLTVINVDPANEHYTSINGVLFTKDMKTLLQYPAGKTDAEYTIPTGVETIGHQSFLYAGLTSIVIPEGVTSIGNEAFQACHELIEIDFASSVKNFGTNAFQNSAWLREKIDAGEVVVVNGVWVNASAVSGDFVIPEGVTSIPDGLFSQNHKITSVYIPASVTSIGNEAFWHCSKLTTVTFEEGSQLKTIGDFAFQECRTLSNIILPDSITTIGHDAFGLCSALTTINIPTSMTNLGNIFYKSGLTSITIPNNIVSIGTPFVGCSNLTEIIVADDHPALKSVDGVLFNKDMTELIEYPAGKTDVSYVVPDGVTAISSMGYNYNLKSIVLPASVTWLGAYCFAYDANLVNLNYCGTQAEWNQVGLVNAWNEGVNTNFKVNVNYVPGETPEEDENIPELTGNQIALSLTDLQSYKEEPERTIYLNNGEYVIEWNGSDEYVIVEIPDGVYSVYVKLEFASYGTQNVIPVIAEITVDAEHRVFNIILPTN